MAFELLKLINNTEPEVSLSTRSIYFNKKSCQLIWKHFRIFPTFVCVLFDKETGDLGFKFSTQGKPDYRNLGVRYQEPNHNPVGMNCGILPEDMQKILAMNEKRMRLRYDERTGLFIATCHVKTQYI